MLLKQIDIKRVDLYNAKAACGGILPLNQSPAFNYCVTTTQVNPQATTQTSSTASFPETEKYIVEACVLWV